MRILILGGTAEAFALSARLSGRPDIDVTLSLAGRTIAPRSAAVPTRVGGFGGAAGLGRWLAEHGTDLVADATHPFAGLMAHHAAQACAEAAIPRLALRRRPWDRQAGDRWIEVGGMAEAAAALGATPRRVFLTIGRQQLAAFNGQPQHTYLARSIELAGPHFKVPHVVALRARGPFAEDDERRLMIEHRIDVMVTKNSGGAATYGKIAAARSLGLPVVIVSPPDKPDGPRVETAAEAVAWIEGHRGERAGAHGRSPVERGV